MKLTKEQCFEQLLLGKSVKSEAWLDKIRLDALTRAQALNFPSDRDDDWRLTDLSALFQHGFNPIESYASLAMADVEKYRISGAIRLVFVDGCYSSELSEPTNGQAKVTVASLAERLGDPTLESSFGKYAPYQQDAFVALNTNFFEDGAWVHIDGEVSAPIHLLHFSTRRPSSAAIYPRSMVVLEQFSRATLVEEYVGVDDASNLTNAVAEVVLKDGAQLQHVRIQREGKDAFHIGHCSVEASRDSAYQSISLAFGSRLSRHTLHVRQRDEGAEIHLDGLALISGRQIADTHTRIHHAAPRGKSTQLHKCIGDGSAHAIFSGKIVVHEGASGTDSTQTSRNLLLSDKARIDAQPQLEIFNDDVSCKHGATIGQIDRDALFFLKSRGLSEERARSLLTHAFAAEIIVKIPVPELVESLSKTILERMNVDRS